MESHAPNHENSISSPGRTGRRAVQALVLAGIVIVVAALVLSALSRSKYSLNRVKCAANMRALGQAIMMYANNNQGQLPDSLATLCESQDISPAVFVCPASDDRPADGATTQAVRDQFAAQGYVSYLYLGSGLTRTAFDDERLVLMCEPLANHGNEGMNVLLGTDTVRWVPANAARRILDQIPARKTPVRLEEGGSQRRRARG